MEEEEFFCTECNSEVQSDFEYCPNCGSIFTEDVCCENHTDKEAEGVCVICSLPFCEDCGESVNNLFLCGEHSEVEIFMGTAKLNIDYNLVENTYLYDLLVEEGFHPIQQSSRGMRGSARFDSFNSTGVATSDSSRIFVPLQEYVEAMVIVEDIINKKNSPEQ